MDNLESTLAAHPFLAGLSSPHLQLVAGCAPTLRKRDQQAAVKTCASIGDGV